MCVWRCLAVFNGVFMKLGGVLLNTLSWVVLEVDIVANFV